MEDVEFSDEFCRFIQTSIPAVDAAELLLLFQSKPETPMSADEAVSKLGPGVNASEVAKYLEKFASQGLVGDAGERRYQYRPASAMARYVETLAQAYTQRPVTLIRVIYALRDSNIRSFAEAFKIRK